MQKRLEMLHSRIDRNKLKARADSTYCLRGAEGVG